MEMTRIPDLGNKSREGMSLWFSEMALRNLLFHPRERPRVTISIDTGEQTFTRDECIKLDRIMSEMFERFGDAVCEAAYPVFMKQGGLRTGV